MTLIQFISFFWPRMTLARFEVAYKDALSKYGDKNAQIIATAMKSTCQALGLRYTADQEAKDIIAEKQKLATDIEQDIAKAGEKVNKLTTKLQDKIYYIRKEADELAIEARNDIAKHMHRVEQVKAIQSVL